MTTDGKRIGLVACLGFLATGLGASGPASRSAGTAASRPQEANSVPFTTHDGYFVSNRFEPNAAASFVVIRSQKEFDGVFGVARVMGDKSRRLAANAFETKMVVAGVKRGHAVWEYKVDGVAAEGNALTLRYTAVSKPSDTAEFASPLIVAVDKGDYASVAFLENGKAVKTIGSTSPATRPVDEKVAAELIRRLGDDDFKVRNDASKNLSDMGPAIHPLLEAKLKEKGLDAEVAIRIDALLDKKPAAAEGARVFDAASGNAMSIEEGVVVARNGGKLVWTIKMAPAPVSLKMENGQVVAMPNNVGIDPRTGAMVWKK